ncbi:MAG: GxxExxY protein [Planctomycetota bacterium]
MNTDDNGEAGTQEAGNPRSSHGIRPPCSESPEDRLRSEVIRLAIEVHTVLGPGFLESAYEAALSMEFTSAGLLFQRQQIIDVHYKGATVARQRLDLIVAGTLILELKAVRGVDPVHIVIARSYLRSTGLEQALILNFGRARLEVRRVFG